MRIPSICQELNDSLIIDLPKDNVEAKIEELFGKDNFSSDNELVLYL